MTVLTDELLNVPPEDAMGEAMRALNPLQRRFVCALGIHGFDLKRAYTLAGYKTTNDNSCNAAASRLNNDERIQAAMHEETLRTLKMGTLYASNRIFSIAAGTDNRMAMKACEAILNRTGYNEKTELQVTYKDDRTHKEILESIRRIALANGVDPGKLLRAPVVDAEFTEVPAMSSDGIEDLI